MPRTFAFIDPAASTDNVGDLFITDSLKRILVHDRARSFDVDPRKPVLRETIDRINREADAAIICGTNLWYKSMPKAGRWMFSLADLKAIKVPIVPFGVGTTRHDEGNDFEPDTLAQIRQIHSSCKVAGARDNRTAEVLEEAGIRNVAMTGCPTLFRSLAPIWRLQHRPKSKRVVVTVRKGAAKNVQKLLAELTTRGLEPVIAMQQEPDRAVARKSIPLIVKSWPSVFEYDTKPYFDLIDQAIGAIGWRLHGIMIHLAHGNPAMLFSNCSRGESFCKTFGLPTVPSPDHVQLSDATISQMIDRLLDPQTFAELPRTYDLHRKSMTQFLEANGLEHRLAGADELALSAAVI